MKKIYCSLKAALAVAVFVILGACEEAPAQQGTDSEETVVFGGYSSELYAQSIYLGKHEFYLVYATCDGKSGHTVRQCEKNHCFLRHSPDCPCHKVESSASAIVTDDAEDIESSDPFDF